MPTDIIDLVDPIRILILLLPERYRGPAAVLLTTIAATQAIASLVVARLPLSARQHPRWGRVVRALHWYAVVRLRDELGSLKAIGADVGPRVTVAPTPLPLAESAGKAGAVAVSETPGFDPGARQTIAPDVVAAAQAATRDGQPGYATVRALLAVVVTLAVGVPVGAIVAGCPNWNRPACPTPGVYSCVRNQPHYCGTSRELTPMGDEPCDRTGRVCAIDPDGTGTCIAAVDGGAQ